MVKRQNRDSVVEFKTYFDQTKGDCGKRTQEGLERFILSMSKMCFRV